APAPRRQLVPGEQQLRMQLATFGAGRHTQQRSDVPQFATPEPESDTAIPAGSQAPARPRTLPVLRVVGQVGAMYIVAEGPAGLYVVDQHAAHARIPYETVTAHDTAPHTVTPQ